VDINDLLARRLLSEGPRSQDSSRIMALRLQQPQAPSGPLLDGTSVWAHALTQGLNGFRGGMMEASSERRAQEREDRRVAMAQNLDEKRGIRNQEALAAGPPEGVDRRIWLAELAGNGNNAANARLTIEREDFNRTENQRIRQEDREFQARLAAANRAPRAPEQLIPTMGPDGNPVLTPLSRAAGQQPWRPPERPVSEELVQVATPEGPRLLPRSQAAGMEPWRAPERVPPIPQFLQRAESDDLELMGTASNINAMLNRYAGMMERGEIPTTLVGRGTAFVQNNLGRSTPESQNLASFRADLERLRNESLRLNNGVQTEGDAQRAWNELIANMNDPGVVARRLQEIQGYNQQAIELRQNLINQRRANFNLPELDTARFRAPVPAAPPTVPQPPAPPLAMPEAPQAAQPQARPGNGGLIDRARARNAASQGGGLPRINSPEEMERLAPGDRFIAPDGSVRVKP
jgi:hypothetical protein